MPEIITWHGIAVEISLRKDWPIDGTHHLELKAKEPLPVTQTGYRSAFLPADAFEGYPTLEGYVRAWLDMKAKSAQWQKQQQARRQLSLF